MEEGQVHCQSVSACDTLLITFQVEVGSEMYATPLLLHEDAPLPIPPPSGSVEPPPYEVGPIRRSRHVQGQEPYFHVGVTRGIRWLPPSDVPAWLCPTVSAQFLQLQISTFDKSSIPTLTHSRMEIASLSFPCILTPPYNLTIKTNKDQNTKTS